MPLADLPQSNKQHAVPQNIMDVEFKLIGDLTIRQFLYLVIFGGSAYFASVGMVGLFKWPIVLGLALLGVGLAFVPIQERGLDEWLVNFVRSVYSPTQMIWRRELTIPSAFLHDNLAVVKQELITLAPTSSRRRLEEFLEYKLVEEKRDPLDIPEAEYTQKVRNAYADFVPAQPSISVGVYEPEVELTSEAVPEFEQSLPSVPEETKEPQHSEVPKGETPVQLLKPIEIKSPLAELPKSIPFTSVEQKDKPVVEQQQPPIVKQKRHEKTFDFKRSSVGPSPMTPDMHSGRRFVNLLPASGELVLPIRGERVVKTSEEADVEDDIQEKAQKLQQLLAQITKETKISQPTFSPQPRQDSTVPVVVEQEKTVNQEAQSLAVKLKDENTRLSDEIAKLEDQKAKATDIAQAQEKDAMIRRLQVEKERTQADFEVLQKQILDLQNKLKEKENIFPVASKATVVTAQPKTPSTLSGRANIITGTIKLKDGRGAQNLLLIVKNSKGDAVRAFKTNTLGQFKLSTPLASGVYTIEVGSDGGNESFDIISIEAKGEPLPPIELVGK